MDRITDRALIEVRRDTGDDLVVTSATAAAERMLGLAHDTLVGSTWGPQFVTADAPVVLEGCRSVLDRRRRAWTGAAQPAGRPGRPVHVTATRPPGSVGSRLQVELIEAAPNTPTVGTTESESNPDEHWFARGLLEPGVAQAEATHGKLQEALAKERELVARLSALDRAKNDFIAAVNHELRTPLTSILGYTDLLLDDTVGELSPQQAHMVTRVERNGRRLLKLVENLLTLSAVQAGAFRLDRRQVDLVDVVNDSVVRSAPDLEAAGLEVSLDLACVPSPVLGDEAHLGRVVTSLMDNAIAFTPAGGTVHITLRREADEAVLEVSDTGVGIPVCDQADLFEEFVRAPDAKARQDQGLGLGLAVLGSIVSAHGGRVTLSSTPDVGTVVTVHLPHAADDRALRPLRPRRSHLREIRGNSCGSAPASLVCEA